MTLMSVQTDSTVFRFGTQSLKVTTGDTGSNALYPSSPVAVVPGEERTLSVYIRTNAPMTGGSIYLRVAQSGLLTPVLGESIAIVDSSLGADVVNGFQRVSVTLTVPAGVFEVRPFVQYSGSTAGQVFWVDGSKFEKGDKASVWQENIVSGRTVLDQMGLMVDAFKGGVLRLLGSAGGSRDTVSLGANGLVLAGDTPLNSPSVGKLRVGTEEKGGFVPAGSIVGFAAAAAPAGWKLCDGSAISRTTFADLFAAIGTVYGAGDGSTTFNVPDLRQRVPLGKAASGTGSTLAGTGGSIDHQHTLSAHTHTGPSHSHSHNHDTPHSGENAGIFWQGGNLFTEGQTFTPDQYANTGNPTGTSAADRTDSDATAGGTGATGAPSSDTTDADNMPYLVINYIIKV